MHCRLLSKLACRHPGALSRALWRLRTVPQDRAACTRVGACQCAYLPAQLQTPSPLAPSLLLQGTSRPTKYHVRAQRQHAPQPRRACQPQLAPVALARLPARWGCAVSFACILALPSLTPHGTKASRLFHSCPPLWSLAGPCGREQVWGGCTARPGLQVSGPGALPWQRVMKAGRPAACCAEWPHSSVSCLLKSVHHNADFSSLFNPQTQPPAISSHPQKLPAIPLRPSPLQAVLPVLPLHTLHLRGAGGAVRAPGCLPRTRAVQGRCAPVACRLYCACAIASLPFRGGEGGAPLLAIRDWQECRPSQLSV